MRDIDGEVVALPLLSVAVNNHLLVILIHITIIYIYQLTVIYISMITRVSVTALISVGIIIPQNNILRNTHNNYLRLGIFDFQNFKIIGFLKI